MDLTPQNCFLVKRNSGRVQFTSEPFNVANVNSFKFSGLANKKAIDVSAGKVDKKNAVIVSVKSATKAKAAAKNAKIAATGAGKKVIAFSNYQQIKQVGKAVSKVRTLRIIAYLNIY